MGGIPTDLDARVVIDERNTPLGGFYAAGECACVSVHGANRLGTNSLVDILVFGRRGARHAAKFIQENDWVPLPAQADARAVELVQQAMSATGSERAAAIRDDLQDGMMEKAGVFREASILAQMRDKIGELRERFRRVKVEDRGAKYNTELLEVIELGGMIDLAEALVAGALARQESRGAHSREDFPKRDDPNWLKHTLAYQTPKGVELKYKPVKITRFEPKERKY
jgi:succinate dehydrogenase / fumarate reductase flavoprotein subunit